MINRKQEYVFIDDKELAISESFNLFIRNGYKSNLWKSPHLRPENFDDCPMHATLRVP